MRSHELRYLGRCPGARSFSVFGRGPLDRRAFPTAQQLEWNRWQVVRGKHSGVWRNGRVAEADAVERQRKSPRFPLVLLSLHGGRRIMDCPPRFIESTRFAVSSRPALSFCWRSDTTSGGGKMGSLRSSVSGVRGGEGEPTMRKRHSPGTCSAVAPVRRLAARLEAAHAAQQVFLVRRRATTRRRER